MPQFIKMGIGTQGYMPKAGASARAKARRAARRVVRPGFPRAAPFTSTAEIAAYFNAERIECLLCGRLLGRLAIHLQRIHGIDEDAYRKRYGLPWRRGLTGSRAHERYVAAGNARDMDSLRALAKEFQPLASAAKQRPKTPVLLADAKKRILDSSGTIEFSDTHFDRFLIAIQGGMTPHEVASLPDMPSVSVWRRKRRRDATYNARFLEIWDALPFSVQARGQRLGPRFDRECDRLFRAGKSDWQIAELLGVTAMTANHRTKKWRHELS